MLKISLFVNFNNKYNICVQFRKTYNPKFLNNLQQKTTKIKATGYPIIKMVDFGPHKEKEVSDFV